MKDYNTFNKLILFTVEGYLSAAHEQDHTKEPLHMNLMSGIRSYMTFCKFSPAEAAQVSAYGEDPTLERIRQTEISFIVYAMELIKLWVENVPREHRKHIHLGVGTKRLKMGRAYFAMLMLQQKQLDPKRYAEKKEIINSSVVTAKLYYSYIEGKLLNES